MILPMKKYSMLIHHKQFHAFLKSLQALGVVDVVDRGIEPDEDTNCEIQRVQQFDRVIKFLKEREQDDSPEKTNLMPGKILKIVLQSQAELEDLRQRISVLEKQYKVLRPWGNFSPDTLKKLEEQGFNLRFFSISQHRFKTEWLAEYNLEIINETEGQTFFVVVSQGEEKIVLDADEVRAPDRSASDVKKEIDELRAKIESTESFFREHARAYLPKVIGARNDTEDRISFDNVKQNAANEVDDRLKIIEGWVPKLKMNVVNDFLDKQGVFYIIDDPTKDDKVPVMLKNGKFSRLFEPIGNLYSLPNYKELDITPFFAPFYMLFFGFCLGDAGYGLLIMLGALIGLAYASKKVKPLLVLGFLLGLSTTIMGIVGGTFFGIMLADQPWPWLSAYQEHFVLNNDQMMLLALGLGYAQVLFGMFLKAANQIVQFGWKFAVSQFGWILIVMFTIPFYVMTTFDLIDPKIGNKIWQITLITGAIPAMFFNTPGKNIFLNIGTGVWNTYNMASGLLGDVLSYIRLFALGISSAILGNVFNKLAVDLSPDTFIVGQLVMILILLFGHSLNFFMAVLGSFVHPLRLTFVEFYKNAGFGGGGAKYKPFGKIETT